MRADVLTEINGDRLDVPNICIIITDGNSTWDVNQTIPQAEMAHAENVAIFSVGITDAVDVCFFVRLVEKYVLYMGIRLNKYIII